MIHFLVFLLGCVDLRCERSNLEKKNNEYTTIIYCIYVFCLELFIEWEYGREGKGRKRVNRKEIGLTKHFSSVASDSHDQGNDNKRKPGKRSTRAP